jgi:hypothetical protein
MPPRIFLTIEETGLSMWVRDSPFWAILSIHAVGMAILVGASIVIALRILGVVPELPLAPLKRLYVYIWMGFWIQIISGVLLLVGYPTKSLMNPDFSLKIVLIAIAMVVMQMLRSRVFKDSTLTENEMMGRGKVLAWLSLVLWFATVLSARLLAYTYTYASYPS